MVKTLLIIYLVQHNQTESVTEYFEIKHNFYHFFQLTPVLPNFP